MNGADHRARAELRDEPGRERRRPPLPLLVVVTAAVWLALDQLTKTWALEALADGPVHVVSSLRLRLSFNTGAAFGIGEGLTPFLMVAGVVLLVALLLTSRAADSRPAQVSLGLVVGGALGNLTDRVVRGHGGAVVDFIDLGWWPVFNVADIGITVGAVLLVLTARRQ